MPSTYKSADTHDSRDAMLRAGSLPSSKLFKPSLATDCPACDDPRLREPAASSPEPGAASQSLSCRSFSNSRSLIDRVRDGDSGVRGVRGESSDVFGSLGESMRFWEISGELPVIVDDAVGVAEDARDTSQGAGPASIAGDAGLRKDSRSRGPPFSVKLCSEWKGFTQKTLTFVIKDGFEHPVKSHPYFLLPSRARCVDLNQPGVVLLKDCIRLLWIHLAFEI